MTKLDTLRTLQVGSFTVTVELHHDELWYSYNDLGKYCGYTSQPDALLYHRRSELLFDGQLWRDRFGRLASEPEDFSSYSRECEYIAVGDNYKVDGGFCPGAYKYAHQDAQELERIESGRYSAVVIVCKVEWHDGALYHEVGHDAVGGYILTGKHGEDAFIARESRGIIREAVEMARRTMERIRSVA